MSAHMVCLVQNTNIHIDRLWHPDHWKVFATLCTHLGTKELTRTAYRPYTNEQMERCDKNVVTRLRHYVADNQRGLDIFVQQLAYAYIKQINRSSTPAASSPS